VKLDKKAPKSIPFEKGLRFVDLVKDFVRAALIKDGQKFVVYVTPKSVGEELAKLFTYDPTHLNKGKLIELLGSRRSQQFAEITDRLAESRVEVRLRREHLVAPMSCLLYETSLRP